MGKLRTAKKSRGHYAAKKEEDSDVHNSVPISSLETIALHTKDKSFSGVKDKRSDALANIPNPKERCLKMDEVPLSTGGGSDSGVTKTGISKKDKRAARHQKWIKRLSNYQAPNKKDVKKEQHKTDDMQSLVDALPSLQATGQNKKKARKFTKKTLDAEINNFVQVLEHPAFKKDPLGTIHLHLTNARKRGLI